MPRSSIDVVRVVAGLRDHANIDERVEELAREPRAFAVGDDRVEPAKRGRLAEWLCEDVDVGPLAKTPDAGGGLVGRVDVVENRDAQPRQLIKKIANRCDEDVKHRDHRAHRDQ